MMGRLWRIMRLALLSSVVWSLDATGDTPDTSQTYQSGTDCQASLSWVNAPALPGEVAVDESNCDFQRFMWQSFLYLVQPSQGTPGALEFETWMPSYGLFVAQDQGPAPWGTVPTPDYCPSQGEATASPGYVYSNLTLQAGSHHPLIDKAGQDVFYGVLVNKPAYDFITGCDLYRAQCSLTLAPDLVAPAGMKVLDLPGLHPELAFPDQSIELKTSWKILNAEEQAGNTFYLTHGTVQSSGDACMTNVVLGLVGLHIVSKTPNHPEFIWATFEHRNNAPDCGKLDAVPPLGGAWTFYDQACEGGTCTTNEYEKGTPTQVCRMHPFGDPIKGTFPNGLDCDSVPPPAYICDQEVQQKVIRPNTENIRTLNASVQAMLQDLPARNANRLWANYELVGNVWTQNGTLPPILQAQKGSLSSANTTMETYVQNGVANVTNPNNCFSCHNLDGKTPVSQPGESTMPVQLPPAGLSHIFNLLNRNTKGCNDGNALPNSCPALEVRQ